MNSFDSCPTDHYQMIYYKHGEVIESNSNALRFTAPCNLWFCPGCENVFPESRPIPIQPFEIEKDLLQLTGKCFVDSLDMAEDLRSWAYLRLKVKDVSIKNSFDKDRHSFRFLVSIFY